jgi:amidase
VATAANLCAASVGTETDGSIVCPSGNNLVVGLKPSMGLLSQDGIIPIGHSQDTAGPMTRTVTDTAIMLSVMQTPFGPAAGQPLPPDYTVFLQRGALQGARIGVDERYFTPDYGGAPDLIAVVQEGMDAMSALGATLVPTDSGDPFAYFDAEFTVLLVEFKAQIADYLQTLDHTRLRTLADLIAFNERHCPTEMKYFGQELFRFAEDTSGDLTDPDYLAARAFSLASAGVNGIDAAMNADRLDAIIAPSYSFASSPAAVAGYPNISVPVGLTPEGKPAGIWMYSGFLQEPRLLALAYDLEQELNPRSEPKMLGAVPPEPLDEGICAGLPGPQIGGKAHMTHHLGTGKPFKR